MATHCLSGAPDANEYLTRGINLSTTTGDRVWLVIFTCGRDSVLSDQDLVDATKRAGKQYLVL